MASRHGKDGSRLDRRTFLGAALRRCESRVRRLDAAALPRKTGASRRSAARRKTQYGSVRGLLKDGVQQFWCVPYGASTGGANRFMPPQKPAALVRRQRSLRDHVGRADGARRRRAVARRHGAEPQDAAERGLPHRQRVHAGTRQPRAARHGVDARRRFLGRLRQLSALRRHEPREEGRRRRRLGQSPAQHLRLPAPGRHRRREVEAARRTSACRTSSRRCNG